MVSSNLPKPESLQEKPATIPTPEELGMITSSAFGKTEAHDAGRLARIQHLGQHLSPEEQEEWQRLGHFATTSELEETHEKHVKDALAAYHRADENYQGVQGRAAIVRKGKSARPWYPNSGKAMFLLHQENPDDAIRILGLAASASPANPPPQDLKFGMDLYREWKAIPEDERPKDRPGVVSFIRGVADKWTKAGKRSELKDGTTVPWAMPAYLATVIPNAASVLLHDGSDWQNFKLRGSTGKGFKVDNYFHAFLGDLERYVADRHEATLAGINRSTLNKWPTYLGMTLHARATADHLNDTLSPGEEPYHTSEVQAAGWCVYKTLMDLQARALLDKKPITPLEALRSLSPGNMKEQMDYATAIITDPLIERRVRDLGLGKGYARLRQLLGSLSAKREGEADEGESENAHPVLGRIAEIAGKNSQGSVIAERIKQRQREGKAQGKAATFSASSFITSMLAYVNA